MHGAIGLGHLRICSHSFRIGKQLLVFHSVYNKNKNIYYSMGTSKLHTLIIVIGGNYTYTMYI